VGLQRQRLPRGRPPTDRRRPCALRGPVDRLADLGYRRATAGITLPNEASVGLHTALGFETVGTFPRIGWKDGAWYDVAWMQRDL
jgi:L-amino acid N-acyltransferase YncA